MKTHDADWGERGGLHPLPTQQASSPSDAEVWSVDELTDPDTRDLEARLRKVFQERSAAIGAALARGAEAAVHPL